MPGTLDPSQNYDHVLQPVSGWTSMHSLQITAPVKSGVTFDAGALVHLDSNGELDLGADDTEMPLWASAGSEEYDTNSDIGNSSGGQVTCYPATGGYELFTTEYKSGDTYTKGTTLLTSGLTTDLGLVKAAGAVYNDLIVVGLVSRGEATDVYGQSILYFWPVYIPPVKITALT